MGESGDEDADETDAGEVADAAHLLLKLVEWNAEKIPVGLAASALAQSGCGLALVYNEVLAHHKVFGTDGDVILIVFLVFVERVVLVDVLHVGCGLVGCIVGLCAALVVGRVALRIVDVLIAADDGGLHLVVVSTAEVVVVVGGGIGLYAVPNLC